MASSDLSGISVSFTINELLLFKMHTPVCTNFLRQIYQYLFTLNSSRCLEWDQISSSVYIWGFLDESQHITLKDYQILQVVCIAGISPSINLKIRIWSRRDIKQVDFANSNIIKHVDQATTITNEWRRHFFCILRILSVQNRFLSLETRCKR